MRMLLTAHMNTEKANQAYADGTLLKDMEGMLEYLKCEAAYFTAVDGKRTCMLVFDMQDSSQMPGIAEPFFANDAEVYFHPVMSIDDLRTGLANTGR